MQVLPWMWWNLCALNDDGAIETSGGYGWVGSGNDTLWL